jgi:predicted PurR-regulated permease PerM
VNGTQRTRFWLAGMVAAVLVLWLFGGVMTPFVAGMAIAYLLDPLCDRLQRLGLARWAATAAVLLLFVLLAIVVLLIAVPVIINQINQLIAAFPDYYQRFTQLVRPIVNELREQISEASFSELEKSFTQYIGSAASWIGSIMGSLWQGGMAVIDILSIVFITPVVAFYLMRDWDRMIATIDGYVPQPQQETVRMLARQVDFTLSRFVRGQLLVSLSLGLFYAITLSLAGLNFAFLVGVVSGVLSIIPYVGTLTGLVASVGIAMVQFDDWVMWVVILGIFLLGQFLEGNFITPKLVGESVGLHPVWVMFALVAGASLFGFTGVLLAVPVAAVIGVLARFALGRYRDSTLYLGVDLGVDGSAPAMAQPVKDIGRRAS